MIVHVLLEEAENGGHSAYVHGVFTDYETAEARMATLVAKAQADGSIVRTDDSENWDVDFWIVDERLTDEGDERLTTVKVGQRVFWHDPGADLASGPATVVRADDPVSDESVIALKLDSGSEAEVLVGELSALPALPAEVLCLYYLDDQGEAGLVEHFCSDECRSEAQYPNTMEGTTTEALPGTVCDACGKLIVPEEPDPDRDRSSGGSVPDGA